MRAGDGAADDVDSCTSSCTEDEANCGLFFSFFSLLFWLDCCLHVPLVSMLDAASRVCPIHVLPVLHAMAWSAQSPAADIGINIDVDDTWHGMPPPPPPCGDEVVRRGGVFVMSIYLFLAGWLAGCLPRRPLWRLSLARPSYVARV